MVYRSGCISKADEQSAEKKWGPDRKPSLVSHDQQRNHHPTGNADAGIPVLTGCKSLDFLQIVMWELHQCVKLIEATHLHYVQLDFLHAAIGANESN